LEINYGKFGEIFSLKIMRDENGNSRGYGYIQFDKKEAAQLCLDSQALVIKGHPV
jgi:RNA recognition motif-containing protein